MHNTWLLTFLIFTCSILLNVTNLPPWLPPSPLIPLPNGALLSCLGSELSFQVATLPLRRCRQPHLGSDTPRQSPICRDTLLTLLGPSLRIQGCPLSGCPCHSLPHMMSFSASLALSFMQGCLSGVAPSSPHLRGDNAYCLILCLVDGLFILLGL